ncbi:MAG: hypothetical protein IAI50_05320, partial [Candidatus Eremiobacteraeota bacterium]|nr:hypothetical protein [Candidatus Eremiobacteraeota bacterium]
MPWSRGYLLLAALALVALPVASRAQGRAAAKPVVFEAPAGRAPAGAISPADAFGGVLPSGRLMHPTGPSVATGTNALGVALAPGDRYAIVTNDDERQPQAASLLYPLATGGYSLAVVDTRTMRVVSRYKEPGETFFAGVVALRDPANRANTLVLASGGPSNTVYALDLDDAGQLSADAHHAIAVPTPSDPLYADDGHAFPGTIVLAPGGTRAYVVDNLSDDVVQLDTASRTVVAAAPVPVGFFPLAAALGPTGLIVANEGLMRYGKLPAPLAAPPFAIVTPDLARASSLSIVPRYADGSLANGVPVAVPLDRTPDGVRQVGGAQPAAVIAMRRRPYAFVAMSNVDRVATVALAAGMPRAVGGTALRLYDRGPYGTQPDALALSANEKRLYVALAGIDAIAVLDVSDPVRPHRVGLIPTGWYPSALALSGNGRYLYVTNSKGIGDDRGFAGSTLERVDLAKLDLRRTTPLALSYLRTVRAARSDAVVPQRFGSAGSSAIKHVVLVLEGSKTYDAMLGDLKDANGIAYGPGDPDYVSFDETVTPNLHALARTYALAGNMYADERPGAGRQFAAAGIASSYTEKTLLMRAGRRPLAADNEDPEDYPRAGYIFNSLAERGRTYRDYGGLLGVSGYDEGEAADPKTDDPTFAGIQDVAAPTQGFGGTYSLDVPALAALAGHVDPNYPGWNVRIRNVRRAAEFVHDFDPFVRADRMPDFTLVWLPGDRGGSATNVPPLAEEVADGDRALGTIVDYLTHAADWSSTAIFIMAADADSTRDHVNVRRTYAIVVSPYAKHRVVSMR